MTNEKLLTLLKEVEAVVNTRPLVYVNEDIESGITLTPSSFLTQAPHLGTPECVKERHKQFDPSMSSADKLLESWKKGQKHLNCFWRIWRDEYLLGLRERMQTKLKARRVQSGYKPTVGNVVLIKRTTCQEVVGG